MKVTKEFLLSKGLFPDGDSWVFQATHWPCSHGVYMNANYLESLDQDLAEKVINRESESAYMIVNRMALKD